MGLAGLLCSAEAATYLQRIDFGQYPEHAFLGPSEWRPATESWGFTLVEGSATMRFSDGSSAGLVAGVSVGTSGQPLGVTADGGAIIYSFSRIPSLFPVASNSFYYTQKFSDGAYFVELRFDGPLEISAIAGSNVAVWSGRVEVASYDSIYNSSVSSRPGVAPVGSFVPFQMTYTLTDGNVWDETLFDRQFFYTSTGTVDLTTWVVPEPSSYVLTCVGLLLFFLKRTR
jgi:hypothetical protein